MNKVPFVSKAYLERVLPDVILIVRRRQNFALVDEVDLESFENLSFREVANAALGHDRYGYRRLDLLDHLGVAHACDTALAANERRDSLQSHYRHGTGLLSDFRLG